MSNRFIKFIPSEEAMYLLTQKGHAFRLLSIVAESARRYEGHPDGLHIGECFIGGFENYDMSEQNYRTAKEILLRRGHIEIIETCRTRKKGLTSSCSFNSGFCKNPTTGVTTISTKVKLLSANVWDINLEIGNDRINERVTTDQRPTNDKQEAKEYKEYKEQPQTPSKEWAFAAAIFECLKIPQLSDQDRKSIMGLRVNESRLKLALEYFAIMPVKTTLVQGIIWHCTTEPPPFAKTKKKMLRQIFDENFFHGQQYNGADCWKTEEGIAFQRGMHILQATYNKNFENDAEKIIDYFNLERFIS